LVVLSKCNNIGSNPIKGKMNDRLLAFISFMVLLLIQAYNIIVDEVHDLPPDLPPDTDFEEDTYEYTYEYTYTYTYEYTYTYL
jgi:hypothetical protein